MAIVALGEGEKARVRQWHQGEAPRRAYGAEGFVVSQRHAVGGGNGHEELAVENGSGRGGPGPGRRHRQSVPPVCVWRILAVDMTSKHEIHLLSMKYILPACLIHTTTCI